MSPEIAVPMMVFGLPVAIVFIVKYFRFREKQLEAGMAPAKLLAAPPADFEKKQRELEGRIENLESILIALDSDLEGRLGAKAVKASPALPAAPQKRLDGRRPGHDAEPEER